MSSALTAATEMPIPGATAMALPTRSTRLSFGYVHHELSHVVELEHQLCGTRVGLRGTPRRGAAHTAGNRASSGTK